LPHSTPSERTYYPFLDGLRAIAILWILFYHTAQHFDLKPRFGDPFYPLAMIISRGFLGVDIFFVISGFLITGLLIGDPTRRIRIERFYLRRCFKIIPSYYFAVIIGIFLSVIVHPRFLRSPMAVLSHFLFFQNYFPRIPILEHTWVVATEMHFYFFYPLVVQTAFWSARKAASKQASLFCIFLLLIILGNWLRWYYFQLPMAFSYPAIWQKTQFRFDALIFGCLIRLLEPLLSNGQRTHDKAIASFSFISSFVIFMYLTFCFAYSIWYHYTLAYLAVGLLIIASLKGFLLLKNFIESPLLLWIGRHSYGIYLWHILVMFPFKKSFMNLNRPALIITYLIASILIGALSTKTIERYFLGLRKRIAP
jgi:peptidoglycan/LPS O-acetylase OafA/YrhL